MCLLNKAQHDSASASYLKIAFKSILRRFKQLLWNDNYLPKSITINNNTMAIYNPLNTSTKILLLKETTTSTGKTLVLGMGNKCQHLDHEFRSCVDDYCLCLVLPIATKFSSAGSSSLHDEKRIWQ